MKTPFLLLSFFVSFLLVAHSQQIDTLFLKIPELKKARIVLQWNKKPPFAEEDNFDPSSGSWILKLTTVKNAGIVLSNTEGAEKVELEDASGIFTITNNILVEKGFTISKNFRISVQNKLTDETIKIYQLKYDAGSVVTNNGSQPPDANSYKAGSMVYDAMYMVRGSSNSIKSKILSHYANNKTASELLEEYAENKFLDSIASVLLSEGGQQGSFALSSVFSAIGGLDVTSLADGAAKFIVKRAKQELSIAFFQKFRNAVQQTPDIGTVFPQTASLLYALDDEIYNYEKYIQNLRETFKKDITEIHRNLPGIIDNHPLFFSQHQPAKAALLTACYTAQELESGAHPGDILASYPITYLDSIANKNYKGAIQTVQLLSASLRDTGTGDEAGYWVNIKPVRELVNDKAALKIYLGLLLQEAKLKYESIPFETGHLADLLNNVAEKYDEGFEVYNRYRNYVLRFGEKLDALNEMIHEYSAGNAPDSTVVEKYARYFRTAVELLEYGTHTTALPIIKDHLPDLRILLKEYFSVAYSAVDLVSDINRKNYSAIVNHAVHIYRLVVDSSFKKSTEKLLRYGSFMATVATAKNSDEVATAIEAAALPVGSSRIKRVSDFNVSLNAYAGPFYGIERINGVDSGRWKANVYGVTAPIGIATSFGHRLFFFKTAQEWSTSLFLSLIDIGAVAAFRFTDDSTAQIPTVRLKNIFSPGAFLSIGIPKTPLSWSIGAQAGPNLRKVTIDPAKGNDFSDRIYWRFSTSFVVDVPVFNLHTRSK